MQSSERSSQAEIVEQLNGFENHYSLETAEITSKIGRLHTLPTSERANSVQDIHKSLEEVNDLLDQMQLVVRELEANTTERTKYELRVRSYQNDKKQLDSELEKAIKRVREEADRDELLAFDDQLYEHRQEDQLIASTQRLERSTRKLQDTHRVAVETEQIGAEMLSNLSNQRETIGRARNRMKTSNADLGRANKTLSTMIRRAIQNRLLLLIVVIIIMFIFLYIVYKTI